MPKKEEVQKLEEKLRREKAEIEASLKEFAQPDPKLKGDFDTRFPEFTDRSPDQGENADEVEEFDNKLPVEHRLELRLRDINEALERIRKETYGICEKCGKEIPANRLEANPAAKTCLNCA